MINNKCSTYCSEQDEEDLEIKEEALVDVVVPEDDIQEEAQFSVALASLRDAELREDLLDLATRGEALEDVAPVEDILVEAEAADAETSKER